jgi:Fe2+ transport system protein FeoA
MKLAEIAIGQVVTVTHVGGDRAFRRRLMELGLVPGTRVQLVGVAPLGDPLQLLVRGCSLSIRRSEAQTLSVTYADDAAAVAAPTAVERVQAAVAHPS